MTELDLSELRRSFSGDVLSKGLEVAVCGDGHNPAGHCALDDGLVIDLSRMRGVDVDPEARVAISQGGATWLDFRRRHPGAWPRDPGGVVGSTGVTGSRSAAVSVISQRSTGSPATS